MAASFGLEPQPYRVLTLLAYLVCAVLFYRYLRALKMTTMAATMAALLGFFTPRNHELLFWFSAVQDQICVIWILALLLCWIRFRQRGSRAAWVGSVLREKCVAGQRGDYRPFALRHAAKSFGVCSSVGG